MIGVWLTGKNLNGHFLIQKLCQQLPIKIENYEILRSAGLPASMPTEHLSNTGLHSDPRNTKLIELWNLHTLM
jgi:hypothetical protein